MTTKARKQKAGKSATTIAQLQERAEEIARDVRGFDIDTRVYVYLTLRNLRDGLKPAEDERTLRAQIGRAEAGESLSDVSLVNPKAVAVARNLLAVFNSDMLPDFIANGITALLYQIQEETGAKLWRRPGDDDELDEFGDWSLEVLSRVFANPPRRLPNLVPELDLAGHVAAVLTHPDTPARLYNAVRQELADLTSPCAVNESADVIRVALEVHKGTVSRGSGDS